MADIPTPPQQAQPPEQVSKKGIPLSVQCPYCDKKTTTTGIWLHVNNQHKDKLPDFRKKNGKSDTGKRVYKKKQKIIYVQSPPAAPSPVPEPVKETAPTPTPAPAGEKKPDKGKSFLSGTRFE